MVEVECELGVEIDEVFIDFFELVVVVLIVQVYKVIFVDSG